MPAMTGQFYDLEENYDQGLRQAVNNNQPTLAFQYLLRKLDEQDARIKELEEQVASQPTEVKKTTAAKKTTKKTTDTAEE